MYSQNISDIFFDLDHTLWDFEKNSALTFQKIFTEVEIDVDLSKFLEVYV
ncbi:MAG: noncanonical pyrimidine nucleotidase, YjjG family, partial [Eudoraea sp.]